MLVLSRKIGESILIGEDITITVCKVSGRQVRLSIDAPKSIPINRYELHQELLAEQKNPIDWVIHKIRQPWGW